MNDFEYQRMMALQEMQNQQMMMQQMQQMQNAHQMQGMQMMQQQQAYGQSPYKAHKPTMKELKEYIANYVGASEMVAVEEFDTLRTRHICKGGKKIWVLERNYLAIPTDYGVINAEFFFCQNCRKLIYNKSSIEL